MSSQPLISVVVPIHKQASKLQTIRKTVLTSATPTELIVVVNNPQLKNIPRHPHERVIICQHKGRGYSLIKGIQRAEGNIIVLLHSDTTLPLEWDIAIIETLHNSGVVGGGFSMSYDSPSYFLKTLIKLSNIRFHLTGVMFGDRAIFARSEILKNCLQALCVPLFEDVRLSKCLRKYGTTRLLKEKVITSAEAFRKNSMSGHLWRVIKSQLWYALGGDVNRIYEYYYSKK